MYKSIGILLASTFLMTPATASSLFSSEDVDDLEITRTPKRSIEPQDPYETFPEKAQRADDEDEDDDEDENHPDLLTDLFALADQTIGETDYFVGAENRRNAWDYYVALQSNRDKTEGDHVQKLSYSLGIQLLSEHTNKELFAQRFGIIRTAAQALYPKCRDKNYRGGLLNLLVMIEYGLFRRQCYGALDRQGLLRYAPDLVRCIKTSDPKDAMYQYYLFAARHILEMSVSMQNLLTPAELSSVQTLRESIATE
jgi:hypothetical protein